MTEKQRELKEQARRSVDEAIQKQREHHQRIKDAADQILEVSEQLHLTWDELELAYRLVKQLGHVRR